MTSPVRRAHLEPDDLRVRLGRRGDRDNRRQQGHHRPQRQHRQRSQHGILYLLCIRFYVFDLFVFLIGVVQRDGWDRRGQAQHGVWFPGKLCRRQAQQDGGG